MKLVTLMVCLCLLLTTAVRASSDIERVVERIETEVADASDAIDGQMYNAARLLKRHRIMLEQELDGMSGVWEDHENVDGNIQIIEAELRRASSEYMTPISVAAAKLRSMAKKGQLNAQAGKAPAEIQQAIDNLLYMEESMAMWHHYISGVNKGIKGLCSKQVSTNNLETIKKTIAVLYDESRFLVSKTFPVLLESLIAARDMLGGKKVDLTFLDTVGTGCANCGGDGCGNCMLPPGEHHDLFDFGCGDECGH